MYDGDLKHQAHENFDNPSISDLCDFVNSQKEEEKDSKNKFKHLKKVLDNWD
jgi:ferritin